RRLGVRVGEADEVPAGIDEGVERVGLALGLAATGRAGRAPPGRVAQQRVARLVEGDVVRQHDRQLIGGYGLRPAGLAIDDRDRAAPVALARDAPVAQAVDGDAFADAEALGPADGRGLGRIHL